MCGIAAIISHQGNVNVEDLKSLANTFHHRGPDSEGYWTNEKRTIGLAHKRLSIIDLTEKGSQPFHYLDRYSMVFNGEIYNYIELREVLISKGIVFNTDSDTEVLIALYHTYGSECLQRLDGMFSFVIYDSLKNEIFGARDRFGEKPFFYAEFDNKLVIASEIKAIHKAGFKKALNDEVVYRFITTINQHYGGENNDDTIFEGVKKLKRGHTFYYSLENKIVKTKQYWDIDLSKIDYNISTNDALEKFNHLFKASISRRLRSDVKVGISLSGGLDSSCIASAIHHYKLSKDISSFSVAFPGSPTDESNFQKIVNDHTQIPNHQIVMKEHDYVELIDKVLYHQDEPFGSTSAIAAFEMYKKVKQLNLTVFLEGQGADEYLSGYNYFTHLYLRDKLAKGQLIDFVKSSKECGMNQGRGLINAMGGAILTMMPGFLSGNLPIWNTTHHISELNHEFRTKHSNINTEIRSKMQSHRSILYHETLNSGLENLLRYNDRNSMASSIEVRLPYLSHELVEFVFSLPSDLKVNQGFTKWILRKAYDDKLPSSIIWRKTKTAFRPHNLFLTDQKNHPILKRKYNHPELGKYFNTKSSDDGALFWKKIMVASLIEKL
jgi:asparagine synthase (glutamine-hydrolysing)